MLPPGKSHRRRNTAVLVVIAVVIIAAALLLGGGLFPAHHSQVIASGYSVIPEGHFTDTVFSVPVGASDPVVTGIFTASGDFNNQITVLIMSAADFQSWENGVQVVPYYNSGQVSGASVSVPLPAGNYYVVVYYDTFAGAASTVVTGQLTLSYTT